MNSNHKLVKNKLTATPPIRSTMMKMTLSTALTICLVQLMYISFARGFILPPSTTTSSSPLEQYRHAALLSATRQDDLLASRSSTTRAFTTTTNNNSRRSTIRPAPLSTTNNNNNKQYTQFFKENVLVGIQRTSPNSRRISGEMIMNIPIDIIWSILTDYDNLSVHVPNLVESKVISSSRRRSSKMQQTMPRVYQRGAQRIFGFEFGADVTMDMMEHVHMLPSSSSTPSSDSDEGTVKQCVIDFKCVDSQFFSEFDGSWIVEEYKDDNDSSSSSSNGTPITMVRYVVDVRPKGPVPVAALEWRIKEDVPVNILAVSKAATAAMAREQQMQTKQQKKRQRFLANDVPQASRSLSTPPPATSSVTSSSPRRRQSSSSSPPSRQLQPIQRFTNQAANNLKRTAKSVLPSPVYSTAKQAVNIINNNLPRRPRRRNDDVVPTMSLQSGGDISGSDFKATSTLSSGRGGTESTSKDVDVDWYDDETMAMYL